MFKTLNSSQDGFLTWHQFYHNRSSSPDFALILELLDVHHDELGQLWDLFPKSGHGAISEPTFVQAMWRLSNKDSSYLNRQAHFQNKELKLI